MLEVRRWAEIRRMKEVEGLSIHEIARRTGHDRNTVRRALRREGPPRYRRPSRPSKVDPFQDEIHRLLQADPKIPGKRIRELIEPLGYDGSKTILDDYLREVRPLFERRRTYQRTVYRPGELLQCDLWETARPDPCRSRPDASRLGGHRGARVLARDCRRPVFSKEWEDIAFGMTRCLARLGSLPETLVWDREGAIHASGSEATTATPKCWCTGSHDGATSCGVG